MKLVILINYKDIFTIRFQNLKSSHKYFFLANITCTRESISRVSEQPQKFSIAGDIRNTGIGDKLNVTCANTVKLFTKDIWDTNGTDNILHIICRPDKYFDVPPDAEMPNCLAKCPAQKPQPNATSFIKLDTTRTNDTEELWEGQKLWYEHFSKYTFSCTKL